MPDELKIPIVTTADTTGAKAAASALKEVNDQAKKNTDVSKQQAKNINDLGETFEKGSAAGRVLGEVVRGNVLALGQLGPVLKAVGQAFKANPLFLIGSIAATLILPAIKAISDGWKKQAEEAKNAGEAAEAGMQRARAAIAKKADNALAETYKEIAEAAKIAEQRINAVTTARIAQTDATEAVALAQIDANEGLSNEAKLLAKAKVQEDARRARAAAQINALNEQDAIAAAAAAREAAAIAVPQRQEAIARARVAQVAARSPAAIQRDIDANIEQERAGNLRGDAVEALFANRNALRAELAEAQEKHAEQLKTAEDALVAAINKRTEAEEKAAQAAADAVATKELNDIKRGTITVQQQAASTVAEIQAKAALPKAQVADAASAQSAAAAGVLSRVRTPVDLNAEQEQAVLNRALEINKNALAQEGRQAGESIGEAVALALREAFPQLTNEIARTVRAAIDTEVKKATASLAGKIAAAGR